MIKLVYNYIPIEHHIFQLILYDVTIYRQISRKPLKTLQVMHLKLPLCFPLYYIVSYHIAQVIRAKIRAQIVRWTIALCRPERSEDKENVVTLNNTIQIDSRKLRYAQQKASLILSDERSLFASSYTNKVFQSSC